MWKSVTDLSRGKLQVTKYLWLGRWFPNCALSFPPNPQGAAETHRHLHGTFYIFEENLCWVLFEWLAQCGLVSILNHTIFHLMRSYLCKTGFSVVAAIKSIEIGVVSPNRSKFEKPCRAQHAHIPLLSNCGYLGTKPKYFFLQFMSVFISNSY